VAACLASLVLALPCHADAGHDHGDAAPAVTGDGPRRLADGSVFLPKPAQRQLGVRTLPVESAQLPRATELAGKVVMDPNAGGRVQAAIAGRIEAGPRGLPDRAGGAQGRSPRLGAAGQQRAGRSNQLAQLARTAQREVASRAPAPAVGQRAAQEIEGRRGRGASLGEPAASRSVPGCPGRDALLAQPTV
jgi:hypothetical protein